MSNLDNLVWEQKYRPTKIDDVILAPLVKDAIKKQIETGNVPNYLFTGPAGTGKTTCARAIAHELGADLLFINASLEGNLDVLRTTITQFVTSVSFTDSKKVVLLDECLSEDESVRVGTLDNWNPVKLKDMKFDTEYPVVSMNMSTGEFENDTGHIISDKHDELFEVLLENGDKIIANKKHPFICKDESGNLIQRTIEEGLLGYSVVSAS